MVIKTPMAKITSELTAGSQRLRPDTCGIFPSSLPPLINSSPTVISTPARPKLNTVTSIMPKPARPKEIAVKSKTSAAGQGSRPPEMPNPSRACQVTGSSPALGEMGVGVIVVVVKMIMEMIVVIVHMEMGLIVVIVGMSFFLMTVGVVVSSLVRMI